MTATLEAPPPPTSSAFANTFINFVGELNPEGWTVSAVGLLSKIVSPRLLNILFRIPPEIIGNIIGDLSVATLPLEIGATASQGPQVFFYGTSVLPNGAVQNMPGLPPHACGSCVDMGGGVQMCDWSQGPGF